MPGIDGRSGKSARMAAKHGLCAALILLAILAAPAVSRETGEAAVRNGPMRIVATGGLGAAILKDRAADRLGTARGGPALELGIGVEFLDFFDFGIGAAAQYLKGRETAASPASGEDPPGSLWPLLFFVQAGVQAPVPLWKRGGEFPVRLVFHAGRFGIQADRPMAGKWYYRPEIRLRIAPGMSAGIGYTFYCDCSDYRSTFALTLIMRLLE